MAAQSLRQDQSLLSIMRLPLPLLQHPMQLMEKHREVPRPRKVELLHPKDLPIRPLILLGKRHGGAIASHRAIMRMMPLVKRNPVEPTQQTLLCPVFSWFLLRITRLSSSRPGFPLILSRQWHFFMCPKHATIGTASDFPFCVVEPQPLGAQALLLALPLWAPDGAIAAFDLTGIDGRLFAVQIGRHVTRAGLLQAADLPDDPRFDVCVGTMPWAIPPTTPVDIKHGDLVQITFAGRGPSIVASFADMLRSDRGWDPDLTFIRAFSGWNLDDAWVLSQDRPLLLHVSAARRRYVRQDLAFRLRIPVDELVLRSPQPRIVDFSYRGWVTCSVLYAAGTENGQHYAAVRDPVCFIDMRPTLRGLNALACHGGRLDLQGLYARANARCPPGFRTQLWYGQHEVDLSNPELQVEDGAVLTAAFLPVQHHDAAGAQGPSDGGPGPSSKGSPPNDGPNAGTSDTPEAPPSPDAGTGSSCSSSPADAPLHYQVATRPVGCSRGVQLPTQTRQPQGLLVQDSMCKFAFASHHVLPEDKQACTSAALVPSAPFAREPHCLSSVPCRPSPVGRFCWLSPPV